MTILRVRDTSNSSRNLYVNRCFKNWRMFESFPQFCGCIEEQKLRLKYFIQGPYFLFQMREASNSVLTSFTSFHVIDNAEYCLRKFLRWTIKFNSPKCDDADVRDCCPLKYVLNCSRSFKCNRLSRRYDHVFSDHFSRGHKCPFCSIDVKNELILAHSTKKRWISHIESHVQLDQQMINSLYESVQNYYGLNDQNQ